MSVVDWDRMIRMKIGRREKSEEKKPRVPVPLPNPHPLTAYDPTPMAATHPHIDKDIICRVTVERRPQPLLVQVVSNKPDATTEDEQAIQSTDLDVLIGLLWRESTTVSQEIDKAHRDATVHIEDGLESQKKSSKNETPKKKRQRQRTLSFFAVVTFSTARA
jgi:hypothetical protein